MEDVAKHNQLIAKYMGGEFKPVNIGGVEHQRFYMPGDHITEMTYNFETETPYHSSWDWLMPVVDKINATKIAAIHIDSSTVFLHQDGQELTSFNNEETGGMLQSIYQAVCWYVETNFG